MSWFDVDRKGLAKLLERKGKAFAIFELVQNAWDEDGTSAVSITLEAIPGKPRALLKVEDDAPEGFRHIEHAYTLFAESTKKTDPTKRGRFNWGEKLVLALCHEAEIFTTKGRVIFRYDGKRFHKPSDKRKAGSVFTAEIRMTREELQDVDDRIDQLRPPAGIVTRYNGRRIMTQAPRKTITIKLPTMIADDEGNLKRTTRSTDVQIIETLTGEEPMIFEMGIPVCELEGGECWHVDIAQKVPLSMERDNVTPRYLRTVRVHMLNAMHDEIDEEDAVQPWARDAVGDERASDEAVTKSLDLRFGKKRVIFDPSDPEANKIAVSKGYTVIHGRSLHKDEWRNVGRAKAAEPAGIVTPSPKPYSDDPNADPVNVIDQDKWTPAQRAVVAFTERLHGRLIGQPVEVTIVNTTNGFSACYGRRMLVNRIDFNVMRLGHRFFSSALKDPTKLIDLLLHEFGHYYSSDHLSSEYHDALTDLGARCAMLALRDPAVFKLE
jgi:hypothetical protein